MASASHLFPFSYCEILMVTMVVIVLLYGCCIVLTPESFFNLCMVNSWIQACGASSAVRAHVELFSLDD